MSRPTADVGGRGDWLEGSGASARHAGTRKEAAVGRGRERGYGSESGRARKGGGPRRANPGSRRRGTSRIVQILNVTTCFSVEVFMLCLCPFTTYSQTHERDMFKTVAERPCSNRSADFSRFAMLAQLD